MLCTQFFSRVISIIALCAIFIYGFPAHAQVNILDKSTLLVDKSTLLACSSCGCNELCAVSAVETTTIKPKDPSLLTDSLWGNLILEMAYQRDKELQKLAKRLGIVNLATMGAVVGIAGGTLAQSIDALSTINPQPGHLDSYAPGIIGTSLSGTTLLTFAGRMYFGHKYTKKLKARQLAIKNNIEDILHHLEYSEAKCPDVRKELADVIGERACGEFLQLWQSSHQLASTTHTNISMLKSVDTLRNAAEAARSTNALNSLAISGSIARLPIKP